MRPSPLFVVPLITVTLCQAQQFEFARLVGRGDLHPDGASTILGFPGSTMAVDEHGRVVFVALDSIGREGVYTNAFGPLQLAADTATPIPGTDALFLGFPDVDIAGGIPHLLGRGGGFPTPGGVYHWTPTTGLSLRFGPGTLLPEGDTIDFVESGFALSGDTLVVNTAATMDGEMFVPVLYKVTGDQISRLAHGYTIPPGGDAPFIGFNDDALAVSDGAVVFSAIDAEQRQGIYTDLGGGLTPVVDWNTPLPGDGRPFRGYGMGQIDGDRILFEGFDQSFRPSIYERRGPEGPITPVWTPAKPRPDGPGSFLGYANLVADSGVALFTSLGPLGAPGNTVYALIDGRVVRVLGEGDVLDGRRVSSAEISIRSVAGDRFVIRVDFAFPETALYIGRILPSCPADFDQQNGVQVADIFAFLRAWFANEPAADFDQQNGIQVADIFAFLRAWFAGC